MRRSCSWVDSSCRGLAHFVDGLNDQRALAGRGQDDTVAVRRHVGAQMGFALAAQALSGPLVAEAELACARRAAADDDTRGTGTQDVLDERRRQLADAEQVAAGHILLLQAFDIEAMPATEDD